MYTIHIPMELRAQAQLIFPDGTTKDMGRVLAIPTKSRHPGFTASKYGIGGQIIATASNAHHIQISVEGGEGRTMSIVPSITFANAPGYDTSFVIDGIGGSGLWGEYSPFAGSPVYVINQVGIPVLFNNMQLFKYATALQVRVYSPENEIEYFEIENKELGRAWYRDANGDDHQFAVVENPVSGTGRFEGTLYQARGMVRANHPGVICVSTCNKREIGGFQIIPLNHTYSAEMQRMRRMHQYIVLRGVNFENLTGQAPFFRGYVRPGDIDAGSRTGLITCLIDGEWQEMPNISGLTDNALAGIEAFRIFLKGDPYERKTGDSAGDSVMSRESLLDWLKEPPEPVVSGSPEDVWVGF
ncbi:MAG: hypothetical protein FWE55_04605 [Synergistaceae bacterium]|nr:hypothetical protein [Synergistaceae bacterium]